MNQNKKRLLKHLSTQHFHEQLLHDLNFFEGNKCIKCGKDFTGAKKSSKRIHVGVYHMQAMKLYEEKYGTSPFNVNWNKDKNIEPIKKEKLNSAPDAEKRLQKKLQNGEMNVSFVKKSISHSGQLYCHI